MHIVENKSTKGKKIYSSVLLRQSYRENGKVKKRTIANLSQCVDNLQVKSHVFICLLAQTVVQRIKQTLKERGWLEQDKENSFSHFMDILSEISLGIFEIDKARKEVVTTLSKEAKGELKLFGIDERYFTDVEKIKKEI